MAQSSDSKSLHDTATISDLEGTRLAIVSTEWNEAIVTELKAGCMRALYSFGTIITHDVTVPGAVELPYACKLVAESKNKPEAIIAFGAVIRGGTPHFDYVCKAVTEGLTQLNVTLDIPIIFGVLTLDNEAQAWQRLGGSHGHKGEEAAIGALKMIGFKRSLA